MGRIVVLITFQFAAFTAIANPVGAQDSLPGPTELRNLASDQLRFEATAKSDEARAESIVKLCDLFAIIRLHPAYAQSGMLQSDGARIRRRLITTSQQLSNQLEGRKVTRPTDLASRVDEALATVADPDRLSGGSDFEIGDADTGDARTGRKNEVSRIRDGARAGGAIPDDGWALVELIQRTIRPDFWESAGGPGTIRYFAMRRVLVVRATTEVHEDLAALLRRL
jgi:hypothetical protein